MTERTGPSTRLFVQSDPEAEDLLGDTVLRAADDRAAGIRRIDPRNLKGGHVSAGEEILMLDTGPSRLLDAIPFADLRAAAETGRRCGWRIGFAGALEAADLPRLLPLQPVLLDVDRAARGEDGKLDPRRLAALAALLEPVVAPLVASLASPDRVFVRDLVVNLVVGAYAHEQTARQRVRFSVEVELAPLAGPRTLADIYSYDRIIDAVHDLAARGGEALVETIAEALATELLRDPRLLVVNVQVEKLDLGPGSAGVAIRRERAAAK